MRPGGALAPEDIGGVKTGRHRALPRAWASARGLDAEAVWRVREERLPARAARLSG